MGLGYFMNDPQQNKQIKIDIVKQRPSDQPYGDLMMPYLQEVSQSQDARPGLGRRPGSGTGAASRRSAGNDGRAKCAGLALRSARLRSTRRSIVPPVEVPAASPDACPAALLPFQRPPPVGTGELPGTDPSIPGMNMTDVGPDRNDPFPNRSFADIVTSVEEAPTGRFMIGVGANSFQGLIGQLADL